jgi:hypothetical protein
MDIEDILGAISSLDDQIRGIKIDQATFNGAVLRVRLETHDAFASLRMSSMTDAA